MTIIGYILYKEQLQTRENINKHVNCEKKTFCFRYCFECF